MTLLNIVLLVAAAVCFLLAALGTVTKRLNLTALGLLLWVLVPLIADVRAY